MNKAAVKINDYVLEQAYLDWQNVRIQMVIGMLAIFFLCLVNFWSVMQLHVPENGSLSAARGLLPYGLLIVFQIIAFVLYFASCLLTALIALEITGRFGNRLGASSALWAGILFCVFPWQADFCIPAHMGGRVISFLCLYTFYLWIRTGRKTNWLVLLLGFAICFEFALTFYLNSGFSLYLNEGLGKGINRLLPFGQTIEYSNIFPIEIFFPGNKGSFDLSLLVYIVYFSACLICLLRLALRTLDYKAFKVIIICVLTAIALSNLPILFKLMVSISGCRWYDYKWCVGTNSLILASAALSIGVSRACLPAIDSGRIRFIRLISCLGLIVLLTLSVNFEKLFTSAHFLNDPYFDE
jgi:hypothetical protein